MIYESFPWKQDLKKQIKLILKYNNTKKILSDEEKSFSLVEKAIFYSAFIVRKLMDCPTKLSDDACQYSIGVKKIRPLKSINLRCYWPEVDSHDWENESSITIRARSICNFLIHSYVFFFEFDEEFGIKSFYVSSDYDKNKTLYKISMSDWIRYIDFIATDSVVSATLIYDDKTKEYKCTAKKRGTFCDGQFSY